jgi:hypothetical protein
MSESIRAKVTGELSYGLAQFADVQITGTAEKQIADRILAIPEIADALDFKRRSERPRDPNSVHGVDHWAGH